MCSRKPDCNIIRYLINMILFVQNNAITNAEESHRPQDLGGPGGHVASSSPFYPPPPVNPRPGGASGSSSARSCLLRLGLTERAYRVSDAEARMPPPWARAPF